MGCRGGFWFVFFVGRASDIGIDAVVDGDVWIIYSKNQGGTQTATPFIINPKLSANALILLYGLAGFGYIITATYLPLLVSLALPDVDVGHIWAVFGLSAVPSCFVWHDIHVRFGTRWALTANLLTQVIGVMLPIMMPNVVGYLISARGVEN